MDSKPDHPPAIAILALAASATAWWFGTSLTPVWWLAWLAPLPLLLAAARLSPWKTALLTLIAIGVGGMNMWDYLNTSIRLPPLPALLAILTPAVLMIPPVLLWRALARRGRMLAATFAFPRTCRDRDEPVVYTIGLVKEKGRWVIDDVNYGEDTTLKERLRRKEY